MVEYAVLLAFIVVVGIVLVKDDSLPNAITGVFTKTDDLFQNKPASVASKDLIENNKDKIFAQIGNFAWWASSSQIGGDENGLPMTVAVGLEGTQLIALKPNTSYRITLDPLTDEELLLFGGYNGASDYINGGLEPVVYADAAANGTGHTKGQTTIQQLYTGKVITTDDTEINLGFNASKRFFRPAETEKSDPKFQYSTSDTIAVQNVIKNKLHIEEVE